MSEQRKKLKTWQGWAIFGGAMVFVFCLGLLAASITNRRAEITTIYANKKDKIYSLQNEKYKTHKINI